MNMGRFLGTKPEITEYSIFSEKLPESFDGFCIAHISDTHSRPAQGIFELIESHKPDIICVTGDMFQDDNDDAKQFWELFEGLLSLAPVYLVTGNHDLWREDSAAKLSKISDMGGILLDPGMRVLEREDGKIAIFGAGDPFSKLPSLIEKDINSQMNRLPQFEGYKILLYHRANLFESVSKFGFDLVLSGHMHGGQIRLPGLGGALAPTSAILSGRMIFPKYTAGKYEANDTVMIVNRGASNTLVIPRFQNPPEVGIIRLYKDKR